MGCLDPKVNKPRTIELLRKKGATHATLTFEGGHDEGSVYSIMLTLEDGSEQELEVWYCGGYRYTPTGYERLSEWENEDQELSELLQGPIDQTFGSWGGVGSTYGTLVWSVETGDAAMQYEMESPREYEAAW